MALSVNNNTLSWSAQASMLIIGATICAGAGTVAFWATDRDVPVILDKVEMLPPSPEPGDTVKFKITLFRKRICDLNVTSQIIDAEGARFPLPPTVALPIDNPGTATFILPVAVPDGAKPGPAHRSYLLHYACNPVQHLWPITVRGRFDFEIVPSTKPPSTSESH